MGNDCKSAGNSNYTMKYFFDKYGEQTMLDVAKANIRRQQIMRNIPEISQKYRQNINKAKVASIRQVNTLETSIFDQIETKIKNIEKQDTGEVSKAQAHFDKCAEQLMGRSEIQKDCSQLRKKILANYEAEQTKTKQKITQDFQSHLKEIQKQRKEKFQQYEHITDDDRAHLRKQMLKKYKKQLKQAKNQVNRDIESGNLVDMVSLNSNYEHLHPTHQFERIKKKSQKLIRQGEQIIMGKTILGANSKDFIPPVGCWGC